MRTAVSRAVLAVALSCLGGRRQEWALAMRSEFDAAEADGRPLSFAFGCLVAAWRELPAHEEGRFIIASYLLAFAVALPAAALLAWGLLGDFPYSSLAYGDSRPWQAGGRSQLLLSDANRAALPSLAALLALLAAAHLRLAWLVLERDWPRAVAAATLAAAATVTLIIFLTVVFGSWAPAPHHAASLAAELAAVAALARWHERSFAVSPGALV